MTTPLRAGALGAAVVTGAVCLSLVPSHTSPSPATVPSATLLRALDALPHRALTSIAATVASFPIPSPLRPHVFTLYCPSASEAALPLKHYSSLADFFARELRDGARPVDTSCSVVAPADATVIAAARLGPAGAIPAPVKGSVFTLRDLIAADDRDPIVANRPNTVLFAVVLRIAPRDCHRFCSPTEWTIEENRHVLGRLAWFDTHKLDDDHASSPYATNERIAMVGSWDHGFFSMTAVGACGVGSIAIQSDIAPRKRSTAIKRGHSLGGFKMGSALVLVFEAPPSFTFDVRGGYCVKAGQSIGRFTALPHTETGRTNGTSERTTETARDAAASRSRIRVRRTW